jgi:hypothetical protein
LLRLRLQFPSLATQTPDAIYKGALLTILVKPGETPVVVRQKWGVPILGQSSTSPFNPAIVIAAIDKQVGVAVKDMTVLQVPVSDLGPEKTVANAQAGVPTVQVAKNGVQPADAPPIICENGVCYVCPDCSVSPNTTTDAKAQEVQINQADGKAPVCATLAGTIGPNKVYITGACSVPAAQDRTGTLPSDALAPGSSVLANAMPAPTTGTGKAPTVSPAKDGSPSWIPFVMVGLALWRTFGKD